jgi:hypothetical protein
MRITIITILDGYTVEEIIDFDTIVEAVAYLCSIGML